jgi:hypothetical protein
MPFRKICFLLLFIIGKLHSQTATQTIRGTVSDKISQSPLPGATIILLLPDTLIGTTTDVNGKFQLNKVPAGKQSLKINFIGYKQLVLSNLTLNSGKELVLNIQLEEDIHLMKEAEVIAEADKNKPLNFMSAVSTRTFSVEQTQKFAAALNDPAIMATSYPGVIQAGDGNNISIRGNSPNGLLWRMEGVEIPNPNHFSSAGSSGGGISILSAQLLSNSDFSTGAFAAEYGNALSGVFDLRLRKGNNQRREYTVQLSAIGADLAAEGPFKKGYDGSYLVNYRYSSLLLFKRLNLPVGDAITNFQDLSFHLSLPVKKAGIFGIFGLGGMSYQVTEAKKDSFAWNEDEFNRLNTRFYANTGVVGLTHTKLFGKSWLHTALAFSGTQNGYSEERLLSDYSSTAPLYKEDDEQKKITLSSTFTKKINAKNNVRLGLILNQLFFDLAQKNSTDTSTLVPQIGIKGSTQTIQGFCQWNYRLSPKLSANIGVHYLQLLLNNSNAVEPRFSLRYEPNNRHQLTLGYGMHSRLQPMGTYFERSPLAADSLPNKGLGLSRAHHVVLGYDMSITENSRLKTEIYYQYLFDIPISRDRSSTYCILNTKDGFSTEALNSKGIGRNYGIELSYERSLYKNFYCLASAALFDSKYRAANGHWYNTAFNSNYSAALTIGKEFALSENHKGRILGFNIKVVYAGGFRYTPVDLAASVASGETSYITAETNTKRNPDYFRLDVRIDLKRNFKRLTSVVALDVQNATNRNNVGGQYFDAKTGSVKYYYLLKIIPIVSYKLEF